MTSFLRLGHQLLDARGMDAPILDQPLHGQTRDFPPDGVEAADDDHAGRIVHDDIHAGGLLEGPDVPPFAADNPALHVVVRDIHRGDRHFAGLLGRVPLDGRTDDLAALVVGDLLGFLHLALDEGGHVVLAFVLQAFEQQLPGFLHVHPGDLEQLVLLLGDQDGELLVLEFHVAEPPVQLLFLLLDRLFLLLEQFGLPLQDILALGQPRFVFAQLGAGLVRLGGELLLLLDGLGGGLDLGGFDDILCFPLGSVDLPLQVLSAGLGPGPGHHLVDNGPEADTESEADEAGDAGLEVVICINTASMFLPFHTSELRNSYTWDEPRDGPVGKPKEVRVKRESLPKQGRNQPGKAKEPCRSCVFSRVPIRHKPKFCWSYPQQHPSGVGKQ